MQHKKVGLKICVCIIWFDVRKIKQMFSLDLLTNIKFDSSGKYNTDLDDVK